ncbi:MAG TPA: DUF2953 domain-containing protein [Clostridiales bacterium]|nr:DUF2953 domain-containing protein [Clostridiales bacterium]
MLIFLIIVIVLAVILLIPVGVDGGYEQNSFELSAGFGPFRLRILPKTEKPKKARRKKIPAEEEPDVEKKPPSWDEILSLVKLGVKALKRFRRRLSIDFFALHYTAAASDPFKAALQYGKVSAAVGTLLPLLEEAVNIRERDVDINVSFKQERPEAYLHLIATLQIWEILYIGLAFGAEYLIMKYKIRREIRETERKTENGQASDQRLNGSYHGQNQGDGGRKHHRRGAHNNA